MLAAFVLALAAFFALAAAPAQAAPEHPVLGSFCEPTGVGIPPCEPTFGEPMGMAVDQSDGDLLVIDYQNQILSRYHEDGTPDDFSALADNVIDGHAGEEDATPQEEILSSEGYGASEVEVAVAPPGGAAGTAGDIYVTDAYNEEVDIFESTGKYLGQLSAGYSCGVAVDPAGNVYVGDYVGEAIHKFVPSAPGTFAESAASPFATTTPCQVAAGAGPTEGFVFANRYEGPVSKIASEGAEEGETKYVVDPGSEDTTVSVDPTSGHVFAATGSEVKEYDASGASAPTEPVSTISLASNAQGIAVNETSVDVYVTRSGAPNVEVFGPFPPGPPTISNTVTGTVTDTSARLFGQINPNGAATDYHFEYTTQADFEASEYANATSVPVPDATLPAGHSNVTVSETIGELAPETTYHFRLVADNGIEVSPGETAVIGADVIFTTRPAQPTEACPNAAVRAQQRSAGIPNPPDCRAYEMLTPPFKATRTVGKAGGSIHRNANVAFPSLTGDRVLWASPVFPLLDDQAFPAITNTIAIQRSSDGWISRPLITKAPILPSETQHATGFYAEPVGSSGNLEAQSWEVNPDMPLLENASPLPESLYTRRDGTGTAGFSNWLPNVEAATVPYGLGNPQTDRAQFNDDGSWMVRWGRYRGLLGATAAEDASVTQLSGDPGGQTIYLQGNPPAGSLDLVNGCTGTGAAATQIPARLGTGSASADTIGAQPCEQGSPTSVRGAAVGGGGKESTVLGLLGPAATAMSNDARRVFFESPDPNATGVAEEECSSGVGASTSCPPQLYVRSYDSDHENPAVSWISRSRSHSVGENGYDGAMISGQQIGLFGRGAAFEGASRDGSIVYFRTNAPLTPDDPNGAGAPPPPGGVTTGTASNSSWDLYQYKLPTSGDPGEGALTRVSGGPNGAADPDTNGANNPTARYISDNGKRVYFVTTSPIAGADNTPPKGGITTPGGTPGGSVRDLYLFDENASGAARYRFIAQLPTTGSPFNACSTTAAINGPDLFVQGKGGNSNAYRHGSTNDKCFRGTPSGSAVVFETTARLTADDTDQVADIYLYDAVRGELTRVSASPTGASPYGCTEEQNPQHTVLEFCNADLGIERVGGESYDAMRGWGGGRNYNMAEDAAGHVSVYFESRSKLLPADANSGPGTGNYWDVYQWREGKLSLVSPGDSNDDAYYSGNSLDGRDVFFQTSQPIDPREIDPNDPDIYDARIGGGFPYTPPPPPCDVLAHECRGPAASGPAGTAPASSAFTGDGNLRPHGNCRALGSRARKLSQRAKKLRHSAARARNRRRSQRMRHKARHLATRAHKLSKQAKSCRRANRRAAR